MSGDTTPDYRPIVLRVLELLHSRADSNGEVLISNREIGRQLGCSIGGLPTVFEHLETDGFISREKAGHDGTLIRLLTEAPPSYAPPSLSRAMLRTRRTAARQRAPQHPEPDLVSQLERAARLKEQGALTDDEFQLLKRKILES